MESTNKKQKKSKVGFRSKSKSAKGDEAAPDNSENASQTDKIKGKKFTKNAKNFQFLVKYFFNFFS
jgi:hypothetical protein